MSVTIELDDTSAGTGTRGSWEASHPMLVPPQFDAEAVFDAGEGGEVAPGVAVDGVEPCLAGRSGGMQGSDR